MATSLVVEINGEAVDAISATIQPKSINQGHQLFKAILDNLGNKYGGTFQPNDDIVIRANDVLIFEGMIDSIKHQLDYKAKWNWMDYLRIAGRDNSFKLAGYKYTKTFPESYEIREMITDALNDTGCPLVLQWEMPTTPTVGGHTIQDGYIFDLVRDVLAKANWYGRILYDDPPEPPQTLLIEPMDYWGLETGITLTEVLGITNLIEADGLDIRNYIEVLGVAKLYDPIDQDAWTETTTDGWTGSTTPYLDSNTKFVGTKSMRATAVGSAPYYAWLKYAKNFNLLYGQNTTLKFSMLAQPLLDVKQVRLYTTDDDYFEIEIGDGVLVDMWWFYNLPLGPDQELSDANPEGIWTKVGDADWFNITAIRFYTEDTTSHYIWVDGLFLEPARPRGFAENTDSQDDYGKREITIINDDLTTQAQVDAEANSKLEKLKDPAVFMPHVVCRGSDFIVDTTFQALPAHFVTLDLPNLEFLDGKYRMENILINVAPYQNLNNSGYDFIVEFDGIPYDAKVDADRIYRTTKGRIVSVDKEAVE